MSAITDIVMVQNFEVLSEKFNAVRICISENYIQKCITKLYND